MSGSRTPPEHTAEVKRLRYANEELLHANEELQRANAELRDDNAEHRLAATEARRELRAAERDIRGFRNHIRWLESHWLGMRLKRAPRRLGWQARALAAPRIGILWQSPAQQLRVPARYLTARAPQPAPTISIVTPAFQGATFIERTLRSVLDQDYTALQYVVQDGGSDDGTVEILERHDERLARWSSAPDKGQAHALNLGFAGTSGELMAYLNADDILLPGSLAYVSAYFAAHPDVDVVYGQRVIIDHNGHRVGIWVTPPHSDHALRHVDYVPQETTFWRRRIWEAAGASFDEDLHFAMDWDLLLRFRAAGARFVRLPRLLGAFRALPEQKTQAQADVGERECMRLRERHLGRALTHDEAGALMQGYLRRSAAHHLAYRARERLEPRWVAVDAGPIESPAASAAPQAASVPR
jgi:hypothetical protein